MVSEKIIAKIKNRVNRNMVCLKMDIASKMDRSILGVNIQYIKNFRIYVHTLGMIEIRNKHTAQFLKDEIINCLRKYNIDIKQLYSSTTDNGANVIKASKLLQELQEEMQLRSTDGNYSDDSSNSDYEQTNEEIYSRLTSILAVVRCAAHTIQLAAHDILKTIQTNIEDCRKSVKKLRVFIRGSVHEIQLPVIDNLTRWNSTFDMINSLYKLRNFIEDNVATNISNLEIDWNFVTNFITAFDSLAKCSKKLQQEQYIIGDFYRDWLTCEVTLEHITEENNLAPQLLNAMQFRKQNLLKNEAFISALYLDPRFNFLNTPFLNETEKKSAVIHLLKTYEVSKRLGREIQADPEFRTRQCLPSMSTSSSNEFSLLENKLQSLVPTAQITITTTRNMKQKLENLTYQDRLSFDANILEYWKKLYYKDEDLGKLVQIALAVPSSQVSVERAFSALTTILTKVRNKLSKETLNNLLIVKLNHALLREVCEDEDMEF